MLHAFTILFDLIVTLKLHGDRIQPVLSLPKFLILALASPVKLPGPNFYLINNGAVKPIR